MRAIPVDTSRLLAAVAMSGAEPVLDLAKKPRANRDGLPLFAVQVAVTSLDGSASVEAVRVAGDPPVVRPGQLVELAGLVARPWEIEGRHGVVFNADAVRPARHTPLTTPPPAPAGGKS